MAYTLDTIAYVMSKVLLCAGYSLIAIGSKILQHNIIILLNYNCLQYSRKLHAVQVCSQEKLGYKILQYNIIILITVLQLPTVLNTVTCFTGLYPSR